MSELTKNPTYYGSKLFTLVDQSRQARKKAIAQSKTVNPSRSVQIVQPDPECMYLSSVQVNAIQCTSTPNEYGGVTIRIGGG